MTVKTIASFSQNYRMLMRGSCSRVLGALSRAWHDTPCLQASLGTCDISAAVRDHVAPRKCGLTAGLSDIFLP